MKDAASLMFFGSLFSAVAWLFWHVLGSDAMNVLVAVCLVVVVVDNARLRRALRDARQRIDEPEA